MISSVTSIDRISKKSRCLPRRYLPGEDGVKQSWLGATRLLQALFGDEEAVKHMIIANEAAAQATVDGVAELEDAHVAFHLLRLCRGVCFMTYFMLAVRSSARMQVTVSFDRLLEEMFRRMLLVLQLPANSSAPSFGVGLLSPESAASSPYLSSRISTHQLVQSPVVLDNAKSELFTDLHVVNAHADLHQRTGGSLSPWQKSWTKSALRGR